MKAHQHSSGAPYGQEIAIGTSVPGNTTKTHMVVESYGLPIHFRIISGEVYDCKEAPKLVAESPKADYILLKTEDMKVKRSYEPLLFHKKEFKGGQ